MSRAPTRDIQKTGCEPPSLMALFLRSALMAAAARFAVSTAFFACLARRGIHFARIIALGLAAAIGAKHFIRLDLYQLVKFLAARFAFVL